MEALSKIELEMIYELLLKRTLELKQMVLASSPQFDQAIELEQKKIQVLIHKVSEMMEGR